MKNLMAVLLAGGLGSRLKTLTQDLPKPLVPYAGSCRMIDYSLRNCFNSGIKDVLLMSKHEERQIHQYLLENWCDKLNMHFGCYNELHHQPPEQVYARVKREEEKGTADALIKNRAYIDTGQVEDVLILHSDHIYNFDYREMYRQHKASGAALTLGYQRIPRQFVKLFGMVAFDGDNNLSEFVEKPANPTSDTVFTAVCIFNKAVMYDYLSRLQNSDWSFDISHDLIPAMLANGEKIKGFAFDDYWEDIGTTERYYLGHLKLIHKQIELDSPLSLAGAEKMQRFNDQGFDNVIMPQSYRRQTFTASDSLVYPGAVIGEGCHIENSVLLPGARVSAGTRLRNALVNEHQTETFAGESAS
mgnify:CR=1 FL=1